MPINVIGNSSSSHATSNKIDTTLFVQKLYLRTNYIESNIEEDNDLKNQYRIENLPDPKPIREASSKIYVVNKFDDTSIRKITKDIDLNDKSITNVKFIERNHWVEIGGQLTSKIIVDIAK